MRAEMSKKDAKRAKSTLNYLQGFHSLIEGSSSDNKRVKRAPTLELVGPRLPRRDKVVVTWADAPRQVQFYKYRINDDLSCLNSLLACLAQETDQEASQYRIQLVKPRATDWDKATSEACSASSNLSNQQE